MAKNQQITEEDLRRIEKDRRELNAAYDNGYSHEWNEAGGGNNTSFLSTESNSDFQDRIDKYGFILSTKLPPQLTLIEQRRNNIEKQRESKWNSMLASWSKHFSASKQRHSEKLVSRIFKGIPNSIRNAAWYKLLDVESQIKAQQGVYEKMKNLARNYSLELRQIDLDINRTFRNNSAYRKRYCQRQKQLYNVLAAYSVYNTEVGYCQGMSTVAALLLMYLCDEERTFWALSQLMSNPKYSMHGFFKSGFPKLIRFSERHEQIIKQLLPKVHKKFTKCNITPLIYTTKWFLQCYIDALPFSLALRVWDVYLLKGEIAMLAMSYCILNMHKRTLLQKDFDMDKINDLINHQLPQSFGYEDDIVMEKLGRCIEKLINLKLDTSVDQVPTNELPQLPFGSFKPSSGLLLLQQSLARKPADEQLRILADADHQKRKNQQQVNGNGGSLSDSDGLDMNDDDDDDDDSDSDDLNPSKLSEYDDDKCDKESVISQMTMSSASAKGGVNGSGRGGDDGREKGNSGSVTSSLENGRRAGGKMSSDEKPRSTYSGSYLVSKTPDYENVKSAGRSPVGAAVVATAAAATTASSAYKPINYEDNFSPPLAAKLPPASSAAFTGSVISSSSSSSAVPKTTSNMAISSSSSSSAAPPNSYHYHPSYLPNHPHSHRIPNSHSSNHVTQSSSGVVSIMSNYHAPPPPRMSNYTATTTNSGYNISSMGGPGVASIRTNPDYYMPQSPPLITSSASSSRTHGHGGGITTSSSITKMSEYVRGPHGIYTRVSVISNPPTVINNSSQQPAMQYTSYGQPSPRGRIASSSSVMPQSASTVQISAGSAANKRTGSLRSAQKPVLNHSESSEAAVSTVLYNHNHNLNGYSSSKPPTNAGNATSSSYYYAPTKVQLENHSQRIANIQQQQQHQQILYNHNSGSGVNQNSSLMTVIGQAPPNNSNSRPYMNPRAPTNVVSTAQVVQRFVALELPNSSVSSSSSSSTNNPAGNVSSSNRRPLNHHNSNAYKYNENNNPDLIEQYDYI